MRKLIYLDEIQNPVPMETKIDSAIETAIELGDAEILRALELKFTNWAARVINAQSRLSIGEMRP